MTPATFAGTKFDASNALFPAEATTVIPAFTASLTLASIKDVSSFAFPENDILMMDT